MNEDLVAKLTPEQALIVVRTLCRQGGEIRAAVLREAENLLADVEVEDVAEDVFAALDDIAVEDCWDRSGADRYGYTSPDEAAHELMADELRPFIEQAARYHELGMTAQELAYCQGMILGLYRYESESESEFKDWAADMPLWFAGDTLDLWKKRSGTEPSVQEMHQWIARSCPGWEKNLVQG